MGLRGYQVRDFVVDLRLVGVWKGDDRVPLEPKSFDVLRHLIGHRDRVVMKEELLDAVWASTFVTPNALTRAVAQLRKALGDDAQDAWLIETVAKRGYRFIAPVTELQDGTPAEVPAAGGATAETPATGSPSRRVWMGIAAAGLLVAIGWWAVRTAPRPTVPAPLSITRLTATGNVIHAAISPDGHHLAYVESARGQQSLWLRQVRGTNPIALVPPAEVGYWGVTFAPDSQSIYYVIKGAAPHTDPSGTLFQIPTLGGTPRRLAAGFDSPVAFSAGGSRIAYLRASHPSPDTSAVMVARADGSGAKPLAVKTAPEFFAPGVFAAPSWSPQGDQIAAAIRNSETLEAHLVTIDVGDGVTREIGEPFGQVSFTSWLADHSGILFIARPRHTLGSGFGAQIWRRPLPGGPSRRITSDLVEYRSISLPADGAALVSVGMTNNAALWVVPVDDAAEPRKIPSLRTDGYLGVAWLDEDTIIFTSPDGSEVQQIWTMKLDGSGRQQLTTDGWNQWPRPSPDGQTIYFASVREGQQGIWRMSRNGAGARLLARVATPFHLALAPDARTLFFTSAARGLMSTWTIPVEGGTPQLVVDGLDRAVVSPDGRLIAGIWQGTPEMRPALAVFSIEGGPPLHVFDGVFAGPGTGGVWWSADGRSLVYTTAERTNVWRQRLDGGDPTQVTSFTDGLISRGDLSLDGRALITYRGEALRDAYLITGFR